MSSMPEHAPTDELDRCPLCASSLRPGAPRCDSCGYHLAASSPTVFGARALLALGALVAAVYVLALAVVLAAR